jgi:2-dehydropantoate 2-reductase
VAASGRQDGSHWSFAVLGPGGVGGLLAGLLARDGHQVTLIARDDTAATLRARGLTVRSAAFGDFTIPEGGAGPAAHLRVVTRLEEPVDACLVTVKATQLDAAVERVPPERLGGGLVVPFLNGVEHVAALRERYPPAQVVAATISVEAYRPAVGEIVHGSPFARVTLATGQADRGRVEALAGHLEQAGLSVTVRADETALLWDKLRFLGPLALATTLAAAPVGVVRTRHREQVHALIRETAAVARALGLDADPDKVIAHVDTLPEHMESSMQRDAAAGRSTELDAIGGAILRAAARTGVEVPTTTGVVNQLRAAEQTRATAG